MNLVCPLTRLINLTGKHLRFTDADGSMRELPMADWLGLPSITTGSSPGTRCLSIASLPVTVVAGELQVRDLIEPRFDQFLVVHPLVALLGSLNDSRWDLLCVDESTAIVRDGVTLYTRLLAFDASGLVKPHPFAAARL